MAVFHYVFAVEYLKAALKLPIIMECFDTEDFERRMEKANLTVKVVNYIFYLTSLLIIIVQMSLFNTAMIFTSGTVAL